MDKSEQFERNGGELSSRGKNPRHGIDENERAFESLARVISSENREIVPEKQHKLHNDSFVLIPGRSRWKRKSEQNEREGDAFGRGEKNKLFFVDSGELHSIVDGPEERARELPRQQTNAALAGEFGRKRKNELDCHHQSLQLQRRRNHQQPQFRAKGHEGQKQTRY
jgi:glyoxylate utilization-related uncharacterized protein